MLNSFHYASYNYIVFKVIARMRIVINKIKQKIMRTVFYYRAALIDNSVYSLIHDLGFRRWNVSRKSAPPLRGRSSFVSRFIASKSRYAVGINAFRNVGREKRRRKRFLRFSVDKNEGFLYPDGCSSLSLSELALSPRLALRSCLLPAARFMTHEYLEAMFTISKR